MDKLRIWLQEHDITQYRLADELGVTPGAVSQWLSGITDPSVENLRGLRRITGMSLDELIEKAA